MKKSAILLAMALAVTVAGPASAHGVRPKFGGVVQASDNMQFELVNKNGAAVIHVAENHGKPVSTAGASGTLTVTNGAAKKEVTLKPSGENVLESTSDAQLAAGAKATATITFADKNTVKVNFISK